MNKTLGIIARAFHWTLLIVSLLVAAAFVAANFGLVPLPQRSLAGTAIDNLLVAALAYTALKYHDFIKRLLDEGNDD